MATDKPDRTVQFITKLVQLSQDGHLRWENALLPGPSESEGGAVFTASIDGKTLRLYKARREFLTADLFGTTTRKNLLTPILEVLDYSNRPSFTFERTTGLNDLYESASYSASGVSDLIDSVLRRP